MSSNTVALRTATPEDAPALLAIYAPYVEQTAITFEYEPPTVYEFRARVAHTLERYPYVVAEQRLRAQAGEQFESALLEADHAAPQHAAPRIIGFAYASPFKGRPAYDWAIETSIYVDANCHRSGVGRALHNALEACLRAQGILNMEACIAMPPNDVDEPHLTCDSARFHECLGYRLVGRFMQCGLKFNTWYDMIWMEKLIAPHTAHAPRPRPFPELTPEERAACGLTG